MRRRFGQESSKSARQLILLPLCTNTNYHGDKNYYNVGYRSAYD